MKKFALVAFAALLAACASAPPAPAPAPAEPAPAEAAAAPAPEPAPVEAPAAPVRPAFKDVVTTEPVPVLFKSYFPNGDLSGTVVSKYTEQGYLLSQETSNANGLVTEVRAGKAKGDLWRVTITNAQTGEVQGYDDRLYSSEGDLLVQTFRNAKEVAQSSNEYTWVEGRKTQWVAKLGEAGNTQSKTVYSYDANGNNTKVEVFDAGNKLVTVFESQYDANGHLQVRKGTDAAGNLVEQTNFTWKGDQKVREETVKPLLISFDYSYGEAGSAPTGVVKSVRGKLVERQTFDYAWFKHTHRVPNKE